MSLIGSDFSDWIKCILPELHIIKKVEHIIMCDI